MARDPLTERIARQLREIDPDPTDWLEVHRPSPWHRYDPRMLAVLTVVLLALIVFGGLAVWWL